MSFTDYAPALQDRAALTVRDEYGLFIGGRFVAGHGPAADVTAPADEERLAVLATADDADVAAAVAAARHAAAGAWPTDGRSRRRHLHRLARLVRERARELAVAESLDVGTPVTQTRDEQVPLLAARLAYYAGWADKLEYAGAGPAPRPVGVVAQIIPPHTPLLTLGRRLAPALAAGDTIVVKPALAASLTALVLAEILQQADLPPGVVNIITGPEQAAGTLAAQPGVDAVDVTGPAAVAGRLARAAAAAGKRTVLDVAGMTAEIVFDDAPVDEAVEGIIAGAFCRHRAAGSTGSRLLVQESIAQEFVDRLVRRAASLRVGDPLDRNTEVGPVCSADRLGHLRALCDTGRPGPVRQAPEKPLPAPGFWFPPTVLTAVAPAHRVTREATGGPLLPVLTFRTPGEALAKANGLPRLRAAGLWTEKNSRIPALASGLHAGIVRVNTGDVPGQVAPYAGGGAASGGMRGADGLAACLVPARPGREAGRRGERAQEPSAGADAEDTGVASADVEGTAAGSPAAGGAAAEGTHPPSTAAPGTGGLAAGAGQARTLAESASGDAGAGPAAGAPVPPAPPHASGLFLGGAFVPAASGRTYPVCDAHGSFLANAAAASPADVETAVAAARAAAPGWSGMSGPGRAQVLADLVEVIAARRERFTALLGSDGDLGREQADADVDEAIEVWGWYAGWADKLGHAAGGAGSASGSFCAVSAPEPAGVVAALAPGSGALAGVACALAPALAAGNTVVAVAAQPHPLAALGLAEALAAGGLPAGVVNILTGAPGELLPALAGHSGIDVLDLSGAGPLASTGLQAAAAGTLKQVIPPETAAAGPCSLTRLTVFLRQKSLRQTASMR